MTVVSISKLENDEMQRNIAQSVKNKPSEISKGFSMNTRTKIAKRTAACLRPLAERTCLRFDVR